MAIGAQAVAPAAAPAAAVAAAPAAAAAAPVGNPTTPVLAVVDVKLEHGTKEDLVAQMAVDQAQLEHEHSTCGGRRRTGPRRRRLGKRRGTLRIWRPVRARQTRRRSGSAFRQAHCPAAGSVCQHG